MDYGLFDPYYDSFLVINEQQYLVYANEAAALLFGISVRRLTNKKKTLSDMVKFEPHLDFLDDIEKVDEPTPIREIDFTSTTGKIGKGQVTMQQDTGNPGNWIIYIRDVTLEETLQKKYRAELDQKEEVIDDLKKARTELENYSRNLEEMVEKRTQEVRKLHQLQSAMLDSLGQGFLVFDENGHCFPTFSKACEDILETTPAGMPIWQVLKLPDNQVDGFKKWSTAAFAEMLPFKDLAPLAPQTFSHSDNMHVRLEYHPMRLGDQIEGIVLVASDVSETVKAQEEANKERAHAEMIISVIRNKNQLASFVRDSKNCLQELQQSLLPQTPDTDQIFRLVHTLKGGAASFSLQEIVHLTHDLESELAKAEKISEKLRKQLEEVIPSIAAELDHFTSKNSELLGPSIMDSQRYIEKPLSHYKEFLDLIEDSNLRAEFTEKFILEPIASQFAGFHDTVSKAAEDLGKQVQPLQLENPENILVEPEVYSELFGNLIHCFRNAVDHGIEFPDHREEKGKPRAGQITVHFKTHGGDLVICISDDGGGIDPAKIRGKFPDALKAESDTEVIQHIFDGQLSTKEVVSTYSGRGVGLDAVKISAEKIGGSVRVESTLGQGSKVTINVPFNSTKKLRKTAA